MQTSFKMSWKEWRYVNSVEGRNEARMLRNYEEKTTPYRKPVVIGRNDPCYCGSGNKFKRCCI